MKRFVIVCLLFFLLLSAICLLLVHLRLIGGLPSLFWETQIFILITTCLLFIYLYKADRAQFIQLYLLTMVVKLIAYGGFAVFVILEDRSQASLNIGFFLFSYLVFTALELVFLYPKISR